MLITLKPNDRIHQESKEDNLLMRSYKKKNKKNYTEYSDNIKKMEKLKQKDKLVNDYNYINNKNKKDLLLNVTVSLLNNKTIKKFKNEEFRKTINREPRTKNLSIENMSMVGSTRVGSWTGSNFIDTARAQAFQFITKSTQGLFYKSQENFNDEETEKVDNYYKKTLYIERKNLNLKINDLFLKLENSSTVKKDKILVITRYMMFINNLIKSAEENPERFTKTEKCNKEGKFLYKNYISDYDLKSYKEAMTKSIQILIKEPASFSNKKFHTNFKEIKPNNTFEEIMDNVYRKVCYITQNNVFICEDLVVNLINKEMAEYLNSKIKIVDLPASIKNEQILSKNQSDSILPNVLNQNFITNINNGKIDNITQNNFKKSFQSMQTLQLKKHKSKNSLLTPIKEGDELILKKEDSIFDGLKNIIDKKYLNDSDRMIHVNDNEDVIKNLLKTTEGGKNQNDSEQIFNNKNFFSVGGIDNERDDSDKFKFKLNIHDRNIQMKKGERDIDNGNRKSSIKNESSSKIINTLEEKGIINGKNDSVGMIIPKSDENKIYNNNDIKKLMSKIDDTKKNLGLKTKSSNLINTKNSNINNNFNSPAKKLSMSIVPNSERKSKNLKKKKTKTKANKDEEDIDSDEMKKRDQLINLQDNFNHLNGINLNNFSPYGNSYLVNNSNKVIEMKNNKKKKIKSENEKNRLSLKIILKEFDVDRKMRNSMANDDKNNLDKDFSNHTEPNYEISKNGHKNRRKSKILYQFLSQYNNDEHEELMKRGRFNSFIDKLDFSDISSLITSALDNFDYSDDITGAGQGTLNSFLNTTHKSKKKGTYANMFRSINSNNSGSIDYNHKSSTNVAFVMSTISEKSDKVDNKVPKKISFNLKHKQSKSKNSVRDEEELKNLRKKLESIKNLERFSYDDQTNDDNMKKQMAFFYNINQKIKFHINSETNEDDKQKYLDFVEKLESMKKFNFKEYLENIERNLKNIKEEIEVIFNITFEYRFYQKERGKDESFC